MKTLLINPPSQKDEIWVREGRCQQFDIWGAPFPPLTLAYLKTQIRDISETLVLDPGPAKMNQEEVFEKIKDFSPDLMIMSVTTPTFENDCNWFAKKVKEILPQIKIGAVGIHVMALPKESLKNAQSLNFVFISEAEAVIKNVVKSLDDLSNVTGIGLRGKESIQVPFSENIDDYGFPDWSDIDFKNYHLPIKDRPFSLISFSRGCPYSCNFCAAQTYYGRKLRKRSVKSIINEINYNLELGVKDFLFWTELISADRYYLEEFLDALKSEGLDQKIDWVCNSRVDQLDLELFKKMKEKTKEKM
ncbi:cobalamin-dependent protein, partial [Patescibacteria group bacterium]|nr:cobalamin-dependent protein [Patescibacteria group bacterium]